MEIEKVREMLKDAPVIKPQDEEEINAKEVFEDKTATNTDFIDKRFSTVV